MDKITVSAPGKLILFGEHAAVYGHPSIVTAVDQRLKFRIEPLDTATFCLEAGEVGVINYSKELSRIGLGDIPKGARFVELAVRNLIEKTTINRGFRITSSNDFPTEFGFGSSSASAVCTVFGISQLLQLNLTNKEIFDLSYKTVLDVQKSGSGNDVAAAVFGGVILYVSGGKVIEPLQIEKLPLLVAYSGIKADTVTLINQVKEKMVTHKDGVEEIFKNITGLVEEAKIALTEKNWVRLGTLMNFNQDYLEDLGVSTEKLDDMVIAARNSGAYGAKLSGAGGGDCMIALVSEEKRKDVSDAITKVGGQVLDVKIEKEGVRIE